MGIPFAQTVMASEFFNRDVHQIKQSLSNIEEHLAEANHLKRREIDIMERQLVLMEKAEYRAKNG